MSLSRASFFSPPPYAASAADLGPAQGAQTTLEPKTATSPDISVSESKVAQEPKTSTEPQKGQSLSVSESKTASQQESQSGVTTKTFSIFYRLNSIKIEEDYMSNPTNLEFIKSTLARSPRIDSITIRCFASPEGDRDHNRWLAESRGEAARKYILDHLPEGSALSPDNIYIAPTAENWEGLTRLAEERYHLLNRTEVLNILHSPRTSTETKKRKLIDLDHGYTYHYLIQNIMPELRLATWICVSIDPLETVAELDPIEGPVPTMTLPDIAIARPSPIIPDQYYRKTIMALRTNLLLPGQSIGVEVPIGSHWSVAADYYYPWFLSKDNKHCLECLEWWLDTKYWLTGDKYAWSDDSKLKGHAIGLYVNAGYYDFQEKLRICRQGEFAGVGIDYTYALPVAHDRLRIYFSIGAGYEYTTARLYHPTYDWKYLIRDRDIRHENTNYFGITRACVSLVWPLTFKYRVKR